MSLMKRIAAGAALTLASASVLAQPPAPAPAPAPLLVGKTMQSEKVDLSALRGKVVMLFIWSTECPVCLDKLPELRQNLEGWRGKDFVIVAASQDRSMADLKAYEQVLNKVAPPSPQMKIIWRKDPAHRDNLGEVSVKMPTTLIIDRNGVVAKKVVGRVDPEIWNDVAEMILN